MKLISVVGGAQSSDDASAVGTRNWSDSVEHVGEVFPGQLYRWFPTVGMLISQDYGQDAVASFQPTEKYADPSILIALTDALVAGSVVYFPNFSERTLVYETFRPNDRPATRLASMDELVAPDTRYAEEGDSCLFLASAGSFNYGHWLIDDLPRAKAWLDLVAKGVSPPTILMPGFGEGINSARRDSLHRLISPKIRVAFLDPNRVYSIPRLYYSTPTSYHPIIKNPAALEFLYRASLSASPPSARLRRLFVGRTSDQGRAMVNQIEINALLEEFGFEAIDPGAMRFDEQMGAFQEASIVVGIMGAGMTNVVFCPPATTIAYLAPAGWTEPFYWDLAVVRGHQYHVLFGEAPDWAQMPHLRDFTIDAAALRTFLIEITSTPIRDVETTLEG